MYLRSHPYLCSSFDSHARYSAPGSFAALLCRRYVRRSGTLGQHTRYRFNPLANLFYGTVEKGRPSLDNQVFYAEVRGQGLCLNTLFCIVGREHLFDESTVALTALDRGVAFVTEDTRPSDVLGIEANRFTCGNSADYAQRVQR